MTQELAHPLGQVPAVAPLKSKPDLHAPLREYAVEIRPIVVANDPFGQQMIRFGTITPRTSLTGIFYCVREVVNAVLAAGGTYQNALAWSTEVFAWLRKNHRVSHQFAAYELNERTARAMEQLLALMRNIPEALIPPPRPPSPFGSRPTTSPFGRKPGTPPSPPPTPAPPPLDPLPPVLMECFEAIAPPPTLGSPPATLPDWLKEIVDVEEGKTDPAADPLPEDFEGLIALLNKAMGTDDNPTLIIEALGKLDDLRTIDTVYKFKKARDDFDALAWFALLGGNVGAAGLLSLLPLQIGTRTQWLEALQSITLGDVNGNQPLNEATCQAIWRIAVAESDPQTTFEIAAINLLAATGRREALPILWEHMKTANAATRRGILAALVAIDPGDQLEALLEAYGSLPESSFMQSSVPSMLRRLTASQFVEPFRMGIPFERLEAILRGPKVTLRPIALRLISYTDDTRVVPLLIKHLSKPMPELREIALSQLRRLQATEGIEAVAKLMQDDEALRRSAAEALLEWGDPRGIPNLLTTLQEDAPKAIVQALGKLSHPAFDRWLLETFDTLLHPDVPTPEPTLKEMFEALVEVRSPLLQTICEKLLRTTTPIAQLRLQVIRTMSQMGHTEAEWCNPLLREMILTLSPQTSYTALTQCKDNALGRELIASRHELQRVLGVQLLWRTHDVETLLGLLADRSLAVRDIATWALGQLKAPESIEAMRGLVDSADRVDEWRFNRAVMAWRALAAMGALPEQPVMQPEIAV